jgi:hypothetical protein
MTELESIGVWQVDTERDREANRRGLGASDLRATLGHLRERGDTFAHIELRGPSRRIRVDLTKPLPPFFDEAS